MLPSCSYRKVIVFFLACLILASGSQVLSPAALPRTDAPTVTPMPKKTPAERSEPYHWLSRRQRDEYAALSKRIKPPVGFKRVAAKRGSFAHWLRGLPVAPKGTPVASADSSVVLAADHPNLAAVIALQPHNSTLLSGANIMLRVRAEYCWAAGDKDRLVFHFTSGQAASWEAWAAGLRPMADGRSIRFHNTAIVDDSRESFCGYLEMVFSYASSMSLLDDTRRVEDDTIAAGDIFLRPGRQGHALMVLDVAANSRGQVRVLLGEGGTPAQTFHVICNDNGSAWFPITRSQPIDLGGRGVFGIKQLRRWGR